MKCLLCNQDFRFRYNLSRHIKRNHNQTNKEYYDIFLKKENDGVCLTCGKTTSFDNGHWIYLSYCSIICANKNKDRKEKIKNTNIKKYGGPAPLCSNIIKQKYKNTCVNNFGVPNPSLSEQIKKQKIQTHQINCGCSHWAKSQKGRLFHRINAIKWIEQRKLNNEPLMPNIGLMERKCIDELQSHTVHKILKNDHHIFNITGFFPDGYIPEIRTIIEYDELFHKNSINKENDSKRDLQLASLLGCIVFRIKEDDWIKNRETIIKQFKILNKIKIFTKEIKL